MSVRGKRKRKRGRKGTTLAAHTHVSTHLELPTVSAPPDTPLAPTTRPAMVRKNVAVLLFVVSVVLMVVGVMVVVHSFGCCIFLATVSLFTHADIDECEGVGDEAACSHTCFNTPGSFTCGCPEGLSLGPNLTSCIGES